MLVGRWSVPLVRQRGQRVKLDSFLMQLLGLVRRGLAVNRAGLVPSLARPGGNTTGISILSPGLDGKRLELLIEAVPAARRIGALTDANGPSAKPDYVRTLKAAAEARGMELSVFEAATHEQVSLIKKIRSHHSDERNGLGRLLDGQRRHIQVASARISVTTRNLPPAFPAQAQKAGLGRKLVLSVQSG